MADNKEYLIHIAALTHQGKLRENNEDTIVFGASIQNAPMERPLSFTLPLDRQMLFLVADGMGGHAAGEVASQFVASRLKEKISRTSFLTEEEIATTICDVNRELYEEMTKTPQLVAMGTTVAGLCIASEGIVVFNVGDSRVYRRQDEYLAQISIDDIRHRTTDADSGRSHSLTQSLGGTVDIMEIMPHVAGQRMGPGRCYLICSDGLSDMVGVDEMEKLISDDVGSSVQALFTQAMEAGGLDNISIIIIRCERLSTGGNNSGQ